MMNEKSVVPYEQIGEEALHRLIDTFYANVARHPVLQPIFPSDLSETARKQKQFMTQYLGGPQLYTQEHGHPMLRARHTPFPIEQRHAEAWLSCMREAMETVGLEEPFRTSFYRRLAMTAMHMVNTPPREEG